ncbi:hypothetical protein Trydic_g4234 [Trypoxylus dichotomus]
MFPLLLNNKLVVLLKCGDTNLNEIQSHIHSSLGLDTSKYYLLQNGKLITSDTVIKQQNINVVLRTCGGKGGFGSMLRAIGAQIEKTTNREACRDLSGRRLRDINEEKRLKKWITQQAEREKEAAERKQRKLEKLCEEPKHKFKDDKYDNERSQLPEIVENAVSQGLKASCPGTSKRKANTTGNCKKKRKLWFDDELEDDLSSGNSEDSDNENGEKAQVIQNSESSCDSSKSNTSVDNEVKAVETATEDINQNEHSSEKEKEEENVEPKSHKLKVSV